MNYYPFHIGDYLSATRHLSWEEDIAYRRLLDVYYNTESPIPSDQRAACRLVLAQTESQREAVKIVLEEFFILSSAGWVNKRADAEIANMRAFQKKQRDKANKRWHPPRSEPGNAADMPRHDLSNAAASKNDANAMPPVPVPVPVPTNSNLVLGGLVIEPPAAPIRKSKAPAGQLPPAAPATGGESKRPPPKSGFAWKSYSDAYFKRYGSEPVRNKKVNSMLCQLVERLGEEEAPFVSAFYVGHNGAWYVKNGHAVDQLLRDAEKLRTEWATGKTVTDTQAKQKDRTQANLNVWAPLIAEAEDRERKERENDF